MGLQSQNYVENGDDSYKLMKAVLRCRQDRDALEAAISPSAVSLNTSTSPPRQKQHVRKLRSIEIQELERQGNIASPADWSFVFVEFKEEEALIPPHHIRQCHFIGPVLLLTENRVGLVYLPDIPEFEHPLGLYNSTLSECVVSLSSLVKDCSYICRASIRSGAALVSCDTVCGTHGGTTYGNGTPIKVGPETGERSVICHVRTSIQEIISLVTGLASEEEKQMISIRARNCTAYVRCNFTIVETGAVLLSCRRILDAYMGCGAIVHGADEVVNCTLLSTVLRPVKVGSGTRLDTVIVKEGSCISGGSTVSSSLLMEHSSVSMHAKVTHSILCPDSGVSAGECHSSLVGPFVGFHHQSLLISAIWPLGRGNVAYGCNVGSNHTTRRADQEIWPGEGMFFGLGCTMKYPSNFLESPYTIIGAGATCLPQRLMMPFSLLTEPSCANVPSNAPKAATFMGLCNLRPGWVLSDNIYMILRNEMKYKMRSKACHHDVKWPVFRSYTVNLMISARNRLREAKPSFRLPDGSAIYIGDAAISGSGKNFVTEEDCIRGIDVYTRYIRKFALRSMLKYWDEVLKCSQHFPCPCFPSCFPNGLRNIKMAEECHVLPPSDVNSSVVGILNTFDGGGNNNSSKSAAATDGNVVRCHHHSKIDWDWVKMLMEDDELQKDISIGVPWESASKVLFEKLLSIEIEMYNVALQSRSKDDIRGTKVIPNYSKIHPPAEDDEVLLAIHSEYEMIKILVEAVLLEAYRANEETKQKLFLPLAEE